eukprot:1070895_1
MSAFAAVFVLIIYRCSSSWIQGSTALPRGNDEIAIGYDGTTDTILLFGGSSDPTVIPTQFVKFKNHQFIDVNGYYLSNTRQINYGQHYTQLNNDLWIIRNGNSLIKIDTTTYAITDPSINIPHSVPNGGCLASIAGFLIVIGGGAWASAMNNVQIYNIGTAQWLSGVPSLTYKRTGAACIVVDDKVYAISGWSSSEISSIESLDVSNLPNTAALSWATLSGKLASGRTGPRAIAHGTDVYVIGGDTGNHRAADVNVIDTISGSCQVVDYLSFGTSYAASIVVNNVLYTFGGWTDPGLTNKYQYTTLPPIQISTKQPTQRPTVKPTYKKTHRKTFIQSDQKPYAKAYTKTHRKTYIQSDQKTYAKAYKKTHRKTFIQSDQK